MDRIEIPAGNWKMGLKKILEKATDDTIIIVKTEAQKRLAEIEVMKLGKYVMVEIS
jgi:hypothetical protein